MSTNIVKIQKTMKLALAGLSANKTRTALSVLGIVIGVAAVIMIVSVGQGLQAYILGQLSSFGSDVMTVEPKIPGNNYQSSIASQGRGIVVTTLKESDAQALRNKSRFPYIETVSGYSTTQGLVLYQEKKDTMLIIAADGYYPQIDTLVQMQSGRFFTEQENAGMENVAVIGSDVAKNFFAGDDPIGKTIRIKNNSFRVIGVLKPRGAVLAFNMDQIVVVPVNTSQKILQGVDYIQEIGIRLNDTKYLAQAKSEIATLLRQRHDVKTPTDDDFQILTLDETMKTISSITSAISFLLGFLAAISLFVGGIGIMNIMLVIVAERTREIGLRKAVGARYRDIMWQFVFEAMAISLLGGLIGVIIGISFSFIMSQLITHYAHLNWPFVVSFNVIFISFFVAACFGVVFGWYPAKEAAQLSPIEALRKS